MIWTACFFIVLIVFIEIPSISTAESPLKLEIILNISCLVIFLKCRDWLQLVFNKVMLFFYIGFDIHIKIIDNKKRICAWFVYFIVYSYKKSITFEWLFLLLLSIIFWDINCFFFFLIFYSKNLVFIF